MYINNLYARVILNTVNIYLMFLSFVKTYCTIQIFVQSNSLNSKKAPPPTLLIKVLCDAIGGPFLAKWYHTKPQKVHTKILCSK